MKKVVGVIGWFVVLGITGIIIFYSFYKFNLGNKIDREKELDINLDLVKYLYDMANPSEDASIIKQVYKEGILSDEYKIDMGIMEYLKDNEVEDEDLINISDKKVLESAKMVLGSDVTYENKDVKVLNQGLCGFNYNMEGKRYEEVRGCGGNMFEKFYRKIDRAIEEDKYLYIYEKSIYVYDDFDDYESRVYVYNDCNMNKLLDYFVIDSRESYEISLDKYIDESATYKYTFVNEGNHYILKDIKQVTN